jgi:hypothetical protein
MADLQYWGTAARSVARSPVEADTGARGLGGGGLSITVRRSRSVVEGAVLVAPFCGKDVDGRANPGHDGGWIRR